MYFIWIARSNVLDEVVRRRTSVPHYRITSISFLFFLQSFYFFFLYWNRFYARCRGHFSFVSIHSSQWKHWILYLRKCFVREFELTNRCLKKWISIWSSDQRFWVQRTSSCGIMVSNGRNAFWGKNGWFCNENGFILLAYGWFCWHLIDFEIFNINSIAFGIFLYTHTCVFAL